MQSPHSRIQPTYRTSAASIKSKQEESRVRNVLNNIFLFLSLIGFIAQATQISVKYFQREVISRLDINKTDSVYPPALSVCSRIGDIDYENNYFTGQQLLNKVPKAADIFNGCRMRLPDSYLILSLNSSAECLEHMTVLKYTRHRQICYRFSLQTPYLIQSYRHSAQSLVTKGLLYEIRLVNQVFTDSLMFDIEFTNTYPDRRLFPPLTFAVGARLYTGVATGQKPKTSFLTSYSLYTNHMLTAPYESNCITYYERYDGTTSRDSCVEKCKLEATMDRLRRVPFTTYISEYMTEYLDFDILSATDLRNETIRGIFNEIEKTCMGDTRCQYKNCYDEVIVTQPLIHRLTDKMEFEIYAPREPYYETYMFPRLEFLDFAIYLASSMGFWLGVTVLDTRKIIMTIRKKLMRSN
ncbi:hypothetical protein HDE_03884 [Halotydeus destructor]|nr:hypothetical protein HDE_03884 [Halotydeus destructor]